MILVDTNVVSEPMKTRSDKRVVAWLDRQKAETLFISTITVSEILFGVASLPAGRRRSRLGEAFEQEIRRLFEGGDGGGHGKAPDGRLLDAADGSSSSRGPNPVPAGAAGWREARCLTADRLS